MKGMGKRGIATVLMVLMALVKPSTAMSAEEEEVRQEEIKQLEVLSQKDEKGQEEATSQAEEESQEEETERWEMESQPKDMDQLEEENQEKVTSQPEEGTGSVSELGEDSQLEAECREEETDTNQFHVASPAEATKQEEEPDQAYETGEDLEKEQVFQVILPVNTSHVFDFIMDPQQLISKTEAAAYGGCTFEEDATLFFRRSDGESKEEYSSRSDALRITNVGTAAVNVTVTADISWDSVIGIAMTDDPDFVDEDDPSLYLALIDGEEEVPISGQYGASIDTWLEGSVDGSYHTYAFQLTGAVNKNADWSELTDIAPEVVVTWRVTMDEE